jgi:hypothetical protein
LFFKKAKREYDGEEINVFINNRAGGNALMSAQQVGKRFLVYAKKMLIF